MCFLLSVHNLINSIKDTSVIWLQTDPEDTRGLVTGKENLGALTQAVSGGGSDAEGRREKIGIRTIQAKGDRRRNPSKR